MKCQKCRRDITENEDYKHLGQILCEDCYMDALSPPKACDPWAVYLATRTRESSSTTGEEGLTPVQKEIYEYIKIKKKATPSEIMTKFNTAQGELNSIMATLRHCELVKGKKEGNTVYLVPF